MAGADRFLGWTEVAIASKDASTLTICSILRRYFINFGIPEELASDGGPPFNSYKFSTFLKSWDIRHHLSSAYNPMSKEWAEAAVKA